MAVGALDADVNKCNHPECAQKRNRWIRQTRNVEKHGDELRKLLTVFRGQEIWSQHTDMRECQRKITSKHSEEALDNGDCIWFAMFNDPRYGLTFKWLWLGYAKIGKQMYLPIHLVIHGNVGYQNPRLVVSTVYDPSEKPWMWDETYSDRVCWKEDQ